MSSLFSREPVDVVLVKNGDEALFKVVAVDELTPVVVAATPVFRVRGLDYWTQLEAEDISDADGKNLRKRQREVVRRGLLAIGDDSSPETIERFIAAPHAAVFLPLFLYIQELTWGN